MTTFRRSNLKRDCFGLRPRNDGRGFHPTEILFSPTAKCNLRCPHCNVPKSETSLSVSSAKKFLIDCKIIGIKRVGFTGGEPFLAPDFLYSIARFAVEHGFLFTSITTNGVWYKNRASLKTILEKLFASGYDGSITVSVDAYHKQNLKKLAYFIESVISTWRRPDMVSIVYVTGRAEQTREKLLRLAKLLQNGVNANLEPASCMQTTAMKQVQSFIKLHKINLSPIGKAARLKNPWDGKWFKEDFCAGPGNVFFVEPSGDVKPCCGYASESDKFCIGNIKKYSAADMIKNIRKNSALYAIFNTGLGRIKDTLVKRGVKFPGKMSDNCFFCHYIMKKTLITILATFFILQPVFALAQYTNDDKRNDASVPPGMEARKVNNDLTVLVPKGAKMYETNKSTFTEESSDEYSSRKFLGIDNRLNKLEEENKKLREDVEQLKSRIESRSFPRKRESIPNKDAED